MKKILTITFLLMTALSFAQDNLDDFIINDFGMDASIGKIMSQKEVTLPVDISSAKMKFTNLGYGSIYFVKVIVPELAAETLLNHRNVGEDGPCLFTRDTGSVSSVVQGNPEVVDVKFKITLLKQSYLSAGKCKVILKEDIRADIRGFHFQHTLSHEMPDRVVEDCQ